MSYPILRFAKNHSFKVGYTATTTFLALNACNQNADYHYYFKYRCFTVEQGEEANCAYDKKLKDSMQLRVGFMQALKLKVI